jgi:uncharacterized membrane protein YphA (DoxX/SURF4 family)
MQRTPITDVWEFLTTPSWTTAVYWLLLIGSVVIAARAWARLPEQRGLPQLGDWLLRLLIGSMWWEESLWKLPPYYTDDPTSPFGTSGLPFWMGQMAKFAPFKIQADFVQNVVLAHFYLFAPIVYLTEVAIGVSLMLGLLTRLGGLMGFLMALNLWAGLYVAPNEWPWTYFFLVAIQGFLTLHPRGRSLGADALLRARAATTAGWWPTVVRLAS